MRILIADSHSIFRIGLKHVLGGLRAEIRIVEADGIDAAIEAIVNSPSIDLAIVELSAPGMDGGNGISRLCSRQVDLPVIVVAADVTRAAALRVVERGAMGLVPKTATGEEVLEAIDTVLEGRVWLPKAAVRPARREATNATAGNSGLDANGLDRLRNLTRRQREVLEQLGRRKIQCCHRARTRPCRRDGAHSCLGDPEEPERQQPDPGGDPREPVLKRLKRPRARGFHS